MLFRMDFLAILTFCVIWSLSILWPILSEPSWYEANQAYRYPYLLSMFGEQFKSGLLYPRWMPELAGGYGYPTFVFYPPGFWFMSLPFFLLGADEVDACKMTLIVGLIVGGLGVAQMVKRFCKLPATLGAIAAFYLTPYMAVQLYERGSLSEFLAALVVPWGMHYLLSIFENPQSKGSWAYNFIGFALSFALIIGFHPVVAFWFALVVGMCMLFYASQASSSFTSMGIIVTAGVIGTVMVLPYWLPAMALIQHVDLTHAIRRAHLLTYGLDELFLNGNARMGALIPTTAIVGLLIWATSCRLAGGLLLALVGLLAYQMPISLPLRESVLALAYLQMPIRALSVATTLSALGVGYLLGYVAKRSSVAAHLFTVAIICVSAVVMTANHSLTIRGPLEYKTFAKAIRNTFDNMTHFDEFSPRTSHMNAFAVRPLDHKIIAVPATARISGVRDDKYARIALRIDTITPARVIVLQSFFPGWHAFVNDELVPSCGSDGSAAHKVDLCPDEHGLINIRLPRKGTYEIEVLYNVWDAVSYPAIAAFSLSIGTLGLSGLAIGVVLARYRSSPSPKNNRQGGARGEG